MTTISCSSAHSTPRGARSPTCATGSARWARIRWCSTPGILGEPLGHRARHHRAQQVAEAAGSTIDALRNAGTRGAAVEKMKDGVRQVALDLFAQGRLAGHGLPGRGGGRGAGRDGDEGAAHRRAQDDRHAHRLRAAAFRPAHRHARHHGHALGDRHPGHQPDQPRRLRQRRRRHGRHGAARRRRQPHAASRPTAATLRRHHHARQHHHSRDADQGPPRRARPGSGDLPLQRRRRPGDGRAGRSWACSPG